MRLSLTSTLVGTAALAAAHPQAILSTTTSLAEQVINRSIATSPLGYSSLFPSAFIERGLEESQKSSLLHTSHAPHHVNHSTKTPSSATTALATNIPPAPRCLLPEKLSNEERDDFPIIDTPDAKSSDITVLTPENYMQTVNNPDQDVFVEYYAPWCEFCQAFEPTFATLATSMRSVKDRSSDRRSATVLIARLNANAWKPPNWDVKAYPTLVFWPASRTSTKNVNGNPIGIEGKVGIEYKGKREKKAMNDFIVEKAGVVVVG